jgi:hypothetical protein
VPLEANEPKREVRWNHPAIMCDTLFGPETRVYD